MVGRIVILLMIFAGIIQMQIAGQQVIKTGTDHIPVPNESGLIADDFPIFPVESRYGNSDSQHGLGVDLESGNLALSEFDFAWLYFNRWYQFHRTYNSLGKFTTSLGQSWRHMFMFDLKKVSDRSFLLIEDDGREIPFLKITAQGFALSDTRLDTLFLISRGGYKLHMFDGSRLEFNNRGLATLIKDEFGNVFYLFYGENNRLHAVLDAVGRKMIFTYSDDKLTQISFFDQFRIHFKYDHGHLSEVMIGNKHKRQYGYENNLLSTYKDLNTGVYQIEYSRTNKVKSIHYPDGQLIHYRYSNLLGLIDLRSTYVKSTDGSNYRYNYWFNRKSAKLNGEKSRVISVNRFHQVTKIKENGELLSQIKYNGNHLPEKRISRGMHESFRYENGSLVQYKNDHGDSRSYRYNADGRVIGIINDADLKLTRFERNHWGLISKQTLDAEKTMYYYDTLGNLIQQTNSLGNERFEYDRLGNMTLYADSLGNTLSASYNDLSQMTELKLSVDWTIRFRYNSGGAVSKIIYPSGRAVTFEYDRLGWINAERQEDVTYYYYFDQFGQPILPEDTLSQRSIFFGEMETHEKDWLGLKAHHLFSIAQQLKKGKTSLIFDYKNPFRKSTNIPAKDWIYILNLSLD